MPLISILSELQRAREGGYAVPCFDTVEMLGTEGILDALAERRAPGIVAIWSGMLDNGATSFWEAVRCDYPDDFHRHLTTYTAYGEYRMSLCHAWSSTPVEWFTRVLLGVNPVAPGYREVEIAIRAPENMNRCEGAVSTPFGPISVSWFRREDGQIIARTDIPEGIQIV